jgi:1-acyl-sn-glycerol-3-phosphate acyltransferase
MNSAWIAGWTRFLTGARAQWRGCLPESRQRIYYANHTSHLDALVIWSVLPEEVRACTRPVAAIDYWLHPPWRKYLAEHILRAILMERKHPSAENHPIEQIVRGMGEQNSVIFFPEGGRFHGPDPQPFKTGLFHLARKLPHVELIPVLLDNLNRVLPKGEFLPVPLLAGVTFGPPVQYRSGEDKSAFLERARQQLILLRNP